MADVLASPAPSPWAHAAASLSAGWFGGRTPHSASGGAAPNLLDSATLSRQVVQLESRATRTAGAAALRRGTRELVAGAVSAREADSRLSKLLKLLISEGDTLALRLSSLQALVCVLEESMSEPPLASRSAVLPFALAQLRIGPTLTTQLGPQVEELALVLLALCAGRPATTRVALATLGPALCDALPGPRQRFAAQPTRLAAGAARVCEAMLQAGCSGCSAADYKAALLPHLHRALAVHAAGAATLALALTLLRAVGGLQAMPPAERAATRAAVGGWLQRAGEATAAAGAPLLSAPARAAAAALAVELQLDSPAQIGPPATPGGARTPVRAAAMPRPRTPPRAPLSPVDLNAAATPASGLKPGGPTPPAGPGLRSPLSPLPNLRAATAARLRSPLAPAAPAASPALPLTPITPPAEAAMTLAEAAAAALVASAAFGTPFLRISASAAPLGRGAEGLRLAFGAEGEPKAAISFATPLLSTPDAAAWRALATPQPLRWAAPLDPAAAGAVAARAVAEAEAEAAAEEEEERMSATAAAAGCGGGPLGGVTMLLGKAGGEIEKATKATFGFVGAPGIEQWLRLSLTPARYAGFLFNVCKDKVFPCGAPPPVASQNPYSPSKVEIELTKQNERR